MPRDWGSLQTTQRETRRAHFCRGQRSIYLFSQVAFYVLCSPFFVKLSIGFQGDSTAGLFGCFCLFIVLVHSAPAVR